MTLPSGCKSWVSCISLMLYFLYFTNWSSSWPPFPRWEAQHKESPCRSLHRISDCNEVETHSRNGGSRPPAFITPL